MEACWVSDGAGFAETVETDNAARSNAVAPAPAGTAQKPRRPWIYPRPGIELVRAPKTLLTGVDAIGYGGDGEDARKAVLDAPGGER